MSHYRNYTETQTFAAELEQLRAAGIDEASLKRWTDCMAQFDENGMGIDTDYSKVALAFPHPIP